MGPSIDTSSQTQKDIRLSVLISATGIGVFLASLDGTIVNISLKTMKDSLNVEQYLIQWVILSYLLAMIAFSAIAGDLGDRISNKLIFQIGMLVFTIGSLLCFFSNTLTLLILSRILQGIGAAGLIANGMAIITRLTTPKNRGTAIGLNAFVIALGVTLGPILGGVLTEKFGWNSIFFVNVPIGIIGLVWVQFAIPSFTQNKSKIRKADLPGSVSLALFLLLFVFSLSIFANPDMPNAILFGISSLACSICMFFVLLVVEKRSANPIIDLKLVKNRRFIVGIFSAILAYLCLCVIIYQLPFFLQEMLEYGQIKTGIIILAAPIAIAVGGLISGILSNTIDARYLATIGMGGITLSLILGATFITMTVPLWTLVVIALVIGIGLGFFIAPNANSVMSSASKEKLGVANSFLSMATNVGFALGTALATAVFSINLSIFSNINGGEKMNPINYVPAMRVMFAVFAFIAILAIVLSYFRGPEREQEKEIKINPPVDN